jgi:peptide deformylase
MVNWLQKGNRMILPLAYYGDPVLRKKGAQVERVTDEIRELVNNMIETMIASKGVGLAAPQVHHSVSLFIAYFFKDDEDEDTLIDRERVRVFINPRIIEYSKELTCYSEGCLSIPQIYEDVERPLHITLTALDLNGKSFTEEFHDFDAHVILHENDHVNGVLFIDRLPLKTRKALEPHLHKIKKKYQFR